MAVRPAERRQPATAAPPPRPLPEGWARRGPALLALATFALHAACWGRYGIFRDELYFLVCGRRLAAGYVDQPPGIALVARLAGSLFGTWVPGLRLLPWVAASLTVHLTGRLAARLSGSGAAATLASVAAFSCLLLDGTAHLLTMNAFEPLLLLALVYVLLRLAEGEDPRLWVAAGALAGLATLMKYSAALTSLALLAGLLLTPARRALRSRWALAGAAVGSLLVLPNLLWQARHGFPFAELVQNGVRFKNAPTTPLQFLGGVLFQANPGNAPLWVGGLLWLLLARAAAAARFAGVGLLLQLLALALGHGKAYYAAPLLPPLLAAGSAAFAALVRSRVVQAGCGAVLAGSALLFSPIAVPILPVKAFLAYQEAMGIRTASMERTAQSALPQVYADQLGWRELVAGVARAYRSLTPAEARRAVVLGKNYGVASAVEILGPAQGIPRGIAVSGHNQYWLWGLPAGRGDPLIAVSDERERCAGFRERILAERLASTPYVMPYEDAHWIWICRGATSPGAALPASARHYE